MNLRWASPLCLLILLSACSRNVETAGEPFTGWPAMEQLATDTMMIVGPDASMGNWAAVKQGASSPAFQQGVDSFVAAEVPSQISSVEPLKKETDQALLELIGAAKGGGDNAAIQAAWEKTKASYDKLTAAVNEAA